MADFESAHPFRGTISEVHGLRSFSPPAGTPDVTADDDRRGDAVMMIERQARKRGNAVLGWGLGLVAVMLYAAIGIRWLQVLR